MHLVGHSGGAAMIVLALERLPLEYRVTCAVLLQAKQLVARSRSKNGPRANRRRDLVSTTAQCSTLFSRRGNLDFAGLSTDGTMRPPEWSDFASLPDCLQPWELYAAKLHDVAFRPGMIVDFHVGEALSVITSRPFLAKNVAPLLIETQIA